MSEPPNGGELPPPDNTNPQPGFPEAFEGYPMTFYSSLGRADLYGASSQEQSELRYWMYDGWIRPDEFDSQGNQVFGYSERRGAREEYERITQDIEYRSTAGRAPTDPNGAGFDWDAWREEYNSGNGGGGGGGGGGGPSDDGPNGPNTGFTNKPGGKKRGDNPNNPPGFEDPGYDPLVGSNRIQQGDLYSKNPSWGSRFYSG